MTVKFLAGMLTGKTKVILKDKETGKVYRAARASEIADEKISDKVKDWDFSKEHIIYI